MPDDPLIGFKTEALAFESLLGKGAMGAVYKGSQLALGRTVAIKVIAPHLASDLAYRERFSREAQTLGKLIHPNVIACHDVGPVAGPDGAQLFVMVLEFVDGWSLGHLLKRNKKLTVRQVLELHRQAAEGLAAAHQLGIVHRDIKPDNIMVTRNGQAKLADFGLAKADDSALLTQTGAILGSPSYMSPEACRGEQPSPSSDLYSLGCTLFHCLTGTTPFAATSALQAIHQHVHAPVPTLASRRPDLAALDELLGRALSKRAEDRHAGAPAMAKAIRAAIALVDSELLAGGGSQPVSPSVASSPTLVSGQQATASLPTSPPRASPGDEPVAAAPAMRRRLWLAAGAAAVALVVLAAVADKRPHPVPPGDRPPAAGAAGAADRSQQALKQDMEASLAAIAQDLADGHLEKASVALDALVVGDDLKERKRQLAAQLEVAWAQAGERYAAELAGAERELQAGRFGEANRTLKAMRIPDRFPELQQRHGEIQRQVALAKNGVQAASGASAPPAPAADHPPGTASAFTVLRRSDDPARTQVRAWPAPEGFPSLPAQQPFGDTTLVGSVPWEGGRLEIRLKLPSNQHPGHDGVVVMLYDFAAPGRELRVERTGGKPAAPATLKLTGHEWDVLSIPLADSDQPIDELRLSVAGGEKLVLAKAVFGSGTVPGAAELQVAPGTLLEMAYKDGIFPRRDHGLFHDLLTVCRAQPEFVDPRQFRLALPAGALVVRRPESLLFLHRIADAMARSTDPGKAGAATVDEHAQLLTYQDPSQLRGLFDQAAAAKAHLLYVLLSTDIPPRAIPAELAKLCGELVEKGCLPVLVLSSNSGLAPERDAWERFTQQLRKEQPGLPIIDLAEVPRFMRQQHLALPAPNGPLYMDAVLAGLEAGVHELMARMRFALDSGGVRRIAEAAPEEPSRRPLHQR